MKIDELIDDEHYAVGVALLERVVAMPDQDDRPLIGNGRRSVTITVAFPFTCTATITGPITATAN